HFVQKQACQPSAVLPVAILRLLGECVVVEPVEQFRAVAGDHLHLRHVNVRIDEARQNEMRPVVDRLHTGASLGRDRRIVAHRRDAAVLDEQPAILGEPIGGAVVEPFRLGQEGEQPAAQQQRSHRRASSNHVTISARSWSVMPETLAGGMAWLRPACRSISRACAAISASVSNATPLGARWIPSKLDSCAWHIEHRPMTVSRTAGKWADAIIRFSSADTFGSPVRMLGAVDSHMMMMNSTAAAPQVQWGLPFPAWRVLK